MCRNAALCGSLLYLLLSFTCYARIVNVTIDDGYGDSLTHQLPIYLPLTVWSNQTCKGCAIKPDPSRAFMQTYNAATYHPKLQNVSITMGFEGIAIYVFFILPNKQANGVTTTTSVNFTVDGQMVGNFTHETDPSTTNFNFNQMVFSKTDLLPGTHQLIISTNGVNISTFTNFDYAIYTKEIEDVNNSTTIITQSSGSSSVFSSPSSTTNSSQPKNTTAAIIGVVVGGISLVGAITALFVWQRLGKRRHRFNSNITAHTSHRKQTRSRVVAPPDYNHQHISNEIVGVPDETGLFSYRPETAMLNDLTSTEQNSPSSRSSHAFLSNLFRRLDRGGTPAESRHYDVGIAQRRVDTAMVYQAEGTANENDRISRMRDQIQARVELLRWQHRDSGVEGLSNDPPPSYAP